ncbi:hypothetical protein ATANTOWER_015611 [Ataeniobius toweri]|uniref:Uncharacterized protein n=1 Tax=Ataeniobius toweri TaxID=208326 RepID=A0ABU7A6K8_9TELE|nr:hypothetical protein [Ataeniobius toweri]
MPLNVFSKASQIIAFHTLTPGCGSLLTILRSDCFSTYSKSLLSSAFLIAFYGLLRLSEFTTPSNSFVPSRDSVFQTSSSIQSISNFSSNTSKVKGPYFIFIAHLNALFFSFPSHVL